MTMRRPTRAFALSAAALLGKRPQADGYVFLEPQLQPWTNQGPERASSRDAYEASGLPRSAKTWGPFRGPMLCSIPGDLRYQSPRRVTSRLSFFHTA